MTTQRRNDTVVIDTLFISGSADFSFMTMQFVSCNISIVNIQLGVDFVD